MFRDVWLFVCRRRPVLIILLALAAFLGCATAQAQLSAYGKDFVDATFSWETFILPAATGAASNYLFKPSGFGSGAEGLGYHYGVGLADNVSGKFLRKFAFAAAASHRDQYSPLGSTKPFKQRLLNVVLHSLFTDPQASHAFNWSSLPASFAGAALSNVYQPDQQRTVLATFERSGTNAAGYFGSDLISELFPKSRRPVAIRVVVGPR